MSAIVTPASLSAPIAASAASSSVSTSGRLPNFVMVIPRIHTSPLLTGQAPIGVKPKPMASVPWVSVPSG